MPKETVSVPKLTTKEYYEEMTIEEVASYIKHGVSTIHRWCKEGNFPAKIMNSDNSARFLFGEVLEWILSRPRSSD